MGMFRKTIACLSLFLLVFTAAGAADIKSRIAAARGREKLDLILQFFQDPGLPEAGQKTPQLLERYAREALALARKLHDRRSEALCEKYAAHLEHLGMRFEPALEGYYRARRAFRELGDRNGEADVNKELDAIFSSVFHVFSDFGRAGEYYAKNLAWSRQSKDLPGITKNLIDLADICHARGDFQEAIPLFLEALQLGGRLGAFPDAGDILTRLGDIYLKEGDPAAAMKYMQQALDFHKRKRQAQDNGLMYSQQGAAYMEQNDFPRALRSYQQALEIRTQLAEPAQSAREMRNLGRLYSRFQRKAQAQEYFQRSQALLQKLSDQNEIIQTILAQAAKSLDQKELQKAEALLVFCEIQAKQKHLLEKLGEARRQLGSLYSLRRDPAKALLYRTLGRRSGDKLPGASVMAGIHKLMAKNESDREIAKIRAQKRRQAIAAALAAFLLLGLIGWLAWKRRAIRRWARSHLFSPDRLLQKKKAQLLDMRQRLDSLQESPGRSRDAAAPGTEDRGREYLRQVLRRMKQDKLFLDSELTLKKMAAQVGANTSSLSKALNDNLGMGFSDFVNHFRIEEAKRIMSADERNEWDLVDICYEVGFNSMSSFYRVFKMHTGATPMEFQHACQAEASSAPPGPEAGLSGKAPAADEPAGRD
jgi:AraC-like DNA-binding protein